MVFRLSCFLAQKRVNHKRGGLSAAQPDLYDKAPLYEPVCAYSLSQGYNRFYLFILPIFSSRKQLCSEHLTFYELFVFILAIRIKCSLFLKIMFQNNCLDLCKAFDVTNANMPLSMMCGNNLYETLAPQSDIRKSNSVLNDI